MAEGRRMATDSRHARQLAFMGATGISGAWKVQVWGATWCMVAWARAMFELLPSLTRRLTKGRPPFGRSPYGKPRRSERGLGRLLLHRPIPGGPAAARFRARR